MHALTIAALMLLATCAHAAAGDVYTTINDMRAGGASCAGAMQLPPLEVKPQLEQAAAAIAEGGELAASVRTAGYRASRLAYIRIAGGTELDQIALLQTQYCAQLLDMASADAGLYQSESQLVIVLAAPFDPRVADEPEVALRKMLALVNDTRAVPRYCGSEYFAAAAPVRWNDTLSAAARAHAEDMARHDYFSHDGRDGSASEQRVAKAGYRFRVTGENITGGQSTPEDAMASLIASTEHCAVLMAPFFSEMGVGFSVNKASELGVYWVQVFGTAR